MTSDNSTLKEDAREGLSACQASTPNLPPLPPLARNARPLSSQADDDLLAASRTLRANHEWHIFTHKKADGDALGSANALFQMGINSGRSVKWFSPDKKLPEGYSYLPHFSEHTSAETCSFSDDNVLYVFLDCANETRSVGGFREGINSLNIDHHEDNSHYALMNCVDGKASSTCELLFRLFTLGGWTITKTIAECLYTGLFTDSGASPSPTPRP